MSEPYIDELKSGCMRACRCDLEPCWLIVRGLEEVKGTSDEEGYGNWLSHRFVFGRRGMGYSVHETVSVRANPSGCSAAIISSRFTALNIFCTPTPICGWCACS
ncbi:ectoine synthase, partial [Aquisalimonas sp.]|uniref:ectoine synthase n=1 Tax=Aquisalimonas sp. TaxID=1872621 RepID=UPI0034537D66